MKWMARAFSWKQIYTGYTFKITTTLALCLAGGSLLLPSAQGQTRVYDLPNGGRWGTYWEVIVVTNSSGSRTVAIPQFRFYPRDPYTTPVYAIDEDSAIYIFCGPGVTYSQFQTAYNDIVARRAALTADQEETLTTHGPTPDWPTPDYGPDDFYLELVSVDTTNGFANLLLHATVSNELYQLEIKTNLNQLDFKSSQITIGAPGTNATAFFPEPINGNAQMYFRAHHASVIVSVTATQDAIEANSASNDPGQPGIFAFTAVGLTNDLTAFYRISGVASNGVDYTNISGTVTIPASTGSTNVLILPIEHHDSDFDETVRLSLVPTNYYLIESNSASVTIVIHDNFGTNIFSSVASGFNLPTGVDYDPATNSLIVAVNGGGNNFWRIDTHGIVMPWSTVTQTVSEVKFAIVKQTASGFTNGQIYFDSDESSSSIGRISPNGSSFTNGWTTLGPDESVQGGLYVDQSGLFGNDLITVTGSGMFDGAGIWRVKADGEATNVVFFPDVHCEGVITLTNDPARWGPWAGKIITGAETTGQANRNLIFAIDTNGIVSTFDLGIVSFGLGHDAGLSCEHFDVIPPGQDLYLVGEEANGKLLKLSHTLLTNYVGDLLITQGGLWVGEPELYIVHWNGSQFIPRGIPLRFYSLNNTNFTNIEEIESVTFAPIIDLPGQ